MKGDVVGRTLKYAKREEVDRARREALEAEGSAMEQELVQIEDAIEKVGDDLDGVVAQLKAQYNDQVERVKTDRRKPLEDRKTQIEKRLALIDAAVEKLPAKDSKD